MGHVVFFTKLHNSALVGGKQPHTVCKQIQVFQSNFVYRSRRQAQCSQPTKAAILVLGQGSGYLFLCNELPQNLVTSNDNHLVVLSWWLTWSLSRNGWKAGLSQLLSLSAWSQGSCTRSFQQEYELLTWQLPGLQEQVFHSL